MPESSYWDYRRVNMARTPDNELRTTVIDVKSGGKKFRVKMDDGRVQEFTLSTQGYVMCPTVGQDVLIKWNMQASTNPQYPDDTYWANDVQPASGGDNAQNADGYEPVDANSERAAQRIDRDNNTPPPPIQREQPVQKSEPIKGGYQEEANTRERSAEWNTAVMTAREVLVANQGWAEGSPPITGAQIAAMARDIFYGKDYPQHEEQAPRWQMPTEEPNQEQGEPEPRFTG